ncbi:hypothetical protein ASG87_11575 [Frateuria sp. Soil773]|uniref:DUF2968 domain-containing protein n=1 Tax=Frateuria sp. Soil773 TaxID=1736407 RepID=UPI0006FC4C48|nr:DUF2968 domain-containing protein [Frateuria sp. Soil773]KRF02115.1 hypothetical protein ASG87_11575 [Frateuria sp. Soil773]
MTSLIRSAGAHRFVVSLLATALTAASASALAAQPPQAHTGEAVAAQDGSVSGGTVDRLRQLMDSHQLTELRTTYNGSYGASLLFQADKLSYYVVLFHDKVFWRVIQSDVEKDAESIYRTFAAQTEKLAEVDLDTLRLQAGKKYAEHMVALNEQRLQNLQQDAARQQQQAQQVAALQQQAKERAVSLSTDLQTTSSQLDAVQQSIRRLEAQQADPELILPAAPAPAPADGTAATAAPAASSSSP